MGLGENFRPRIPSRNWLIFLSVTGTFTAAVIYDKRETRRAQRKWCKLVEHIAKEPLERQEMPRKLTVFLESPPSDGLRSAQDHFKEYVKPILVASGLDWEFIQGRKEGDVRAELAEKIRNSRIPPEERTEESIVEEVRRRSGIKEYDGVRGDIILGRHTWKEYVRGLHEGWLGPLTEPPKMSEEKPTEDIITAEKTEATKDITNGNTSHPTTVDDDGTTSPDQAPPPPSLRLIPTRNPRNLHGQHLLSKHPNIYLRQHHRISPLSLVLQQLSPFLIFWDFSIHQDDYIVSLTDECWRTRLGEKRLP